MIYWFIGQPGAGKTTMAKKLKTFLENEYNTHVFHVDGDDIRELLENKDYSRDGRIKNITFAQGLAAYLNRHGNVVVSVVTPYLDVREAFKKKLDQRIVEIYVTTKDIRGRENFHVQDFEAPEERYILLDTTDISEEDAFKQLKEDLAL
jgi:adenylylsulfate kinase-like enzyme